MALFQELIGLALGKAGSSAWLNNGPREKKLGVMMCRRLEALGGLLGVFIASRRDWKKDTTGPGCV